ncbi:hypothetical protein, partial [Stenotrophomonas maltophilia]|uniref:hypothetical protein n=2 Tax=Stenotrophomonas TaxID=40323 RepID=UPI0019538B31
GVTGSNPVPPTTWLPALPVQRWITTEAGLVPAFLVSGIDHGSTWSALHDQVFDADHPLQLPVTVHALPDLGDANRRTTRGLGNAGFVLQGLLGQPQDPVLAQPVKQQGGRTAILSYDVRLLGFGTQDLAAKGLFSGPVASAEQAGEQQHQGKHRHGTVLQRESARRLA